MSLPGEKDSQSEEEQLEVENGNKEFGEQNNVLTKNKNGNVQSQEPESNLMSDNSSNIGLKLLKMMGWSGGGLGAKEQGIIEPIKPVNRGKSKAGLGSEWVRPKGLKSVKTKNRKFDSSAEDSSVDEDLTPIKQIIKKYNNSYGDFNDLVFSPKFTKEQRAALHR